MPNDARSSGRPSTWAVYARLFRGAGPPAGAMAAIVALTLAGTLVAVAVPWPMQFLVDHVLGTRPVSTRAARVLAALGLHSKTAAVFALAVTALLLHLTGGLLDAARARLEVATGHGVANALRARVFDHLQRLSLLEHRVMPMGDQLYRLNYDTACVDQLLVSGLLPLAGAGLRLAAMFFILWGLDRGLALLTLAVVPPMVLCVRYHIGRLEAESQGVCERESEVLGLAERVLGALPIVKAFVREDDESTRFRAQSDRALAARMALTVRETWFGLAVNGVTATGTAAVMAAGGLKVLAGTLTVGQLLVVIAYLASVYDPLHAISHTLGQMQSALAGARRVLDVLAKEVEPRREHGARELPPVRGHILMDGVTFGYRPEAPAVEEVSFEATPGSMVAIVGHTGAGKTTLAGLLLRYFDPQRGRVLIDGHDLREVSVASLRRQISLVPQESTLFPVSIAENIRYSKPEASDDEIYAAAVAAHAHEFIAALPEGYRTILAEGGASVSGGERQRIALARAFLKGAPILILDEPTSSLDASTEALILESLGRLMAGRTAIIIAHRLSTIRRADQILVIQDGRLVERGTHRELLADQGRYASLHRLYSKAAGTDS